MKKKLLLIILPVFLFAASLQAQIKVWNFACDNLPGYDNLLDTNAEVEAALYSDPASSIALSGGFDTGNNIASWGDPAADNVFYVGNDAGQRFRLNTAGFTAYNNESKSVFDSFFGAGVPWGRFYVPGNGSETGRYFGFNLTSGDVITMYYYIDTNDVLHDVTIVTPSASSTVQADNTAAKEGHMLQITATEDGLYKVYCGTGKLCVGRIYEGDVVLVDGVLSTNKAVSAVSTNLKAVNNRVYISNVKSSTEVNVYSITGALVKSLKINEATNFSLKQGVYIATVKTLEGQKSVKLLLQ
ncbi:T9SS type A sorting domain-containing protein [Thalassobellus suaedae]|uniref:T9SS type A sorting domain-containing protein n=1 Tax=Thalassobellus suaedae TaxID=3074124 RepID=A0ABY9XTL4_9FLAO|nr:T9SS type A sorting domain-containing protein [Flavobacteriaceae bacterium HL-DH14]